MSDATFTPTVDGDVHISHVDANDSAKYRRAKEQAAAAGRTLVIDPAPVAAPRKPSAGAIVVTPATDVPTYRRLKAQAERDGKPLTFVDREGNLT